MKNIIEKIKLEELGVAEVGKEWATSREYSSRRAINEIAEKVNEIIQYLEDEKKYQLI